MKKIFIVLFFIAVIAGIVLFVRFGPKDKPVGQGTVIMTADATEGTLFSGYHGVVSVSFNMDDDTIVIAGDPGGSYVSPSVGDPVMFNTASSFDDTILSESTVYFVRTASLSDRFEVSTVPGGAITTFADTASADGQELLTLEMPANTYNVQGLEHITLSLSADDAASLSIKFLGSIQNDVPSWYIAQSTTNRWETVGVFDIATQTEIEGDTGVNFAGTDDTRIFEVYTKGLNWISVISSKYASGSADLRIRGAQ